MSVLLCETFDLAIQAAEVFQSDDIRVVIGAPQRPGDRWTIFPLSSQEMPFMVGEDAWSCAMRTRCRG